MQNNQSNAPACPQLLGLRCILQSTFCSFDFILTCAMGVTTASDKSDFNSHGFSISRFCADSSTWQAGNFLITKHFMLLKSHHVYNEGGKGKRYSASVTGNDLKRCLWGRHCCWFARGHFALSYPTYVSCDGSRRGESGQQVRHDRGDRAENCSMGSSGQDSDSCTHLYCCAAQITLQVHWFHRERDRYIFLNQLIVTSEFTIRPKLKPTNLLRSNSPKFSNIL